MCDHVRKDGCLLDNLGNPCPLDCPHYGDPKWIVLDPAHGDIPDEEREDDILDILYGNVTVRGTRKVLREHGLLETLPEIVL